ncbi:MAG: DUF1993 family protein [Amphiplicatus sp.]
MSFSASAIIHTILTQMYPGLNGVLEKGAAYAESKNIDEQVLLNWRLAPDMWPMIRQVQIATELPARGLARLAGAEIPSFPDTEKSFAELRARIAKAHAFIKDLDAAKIDADPDGDITFPVRQDQMTMKRRLYLLHFLVPNLYFHVTMAYGNLRACGVPIGKGDYLARPQ